jgi:glutamate dehydrogenase/leucine dehydrogenase
MVVRDRPYSELRDSLVGKKVVIWTCNTCARLCYDIGGEAAAVRLADALRKDGIDVLSVLHTGASCVEKKVREKNDENVAKADIVISMTCNIGALCARRAFEKEILNPIATLGAGFIDENRTIFVCEDNSGELLVKGLREIAEEKGFWCDPYA